MKKHLFLFAICTFLSVTLWAQFPPDNRGSGGFNNNEFANPRDSIQGDVLLDTFKIFSYLPVTFYREYFFADTGLTNFTHQLDPARRLRFDYQNLGVNGSAAQPYIYQGTWRQGIDIGFHQFDLYYLHADSIPFYRLERPFALMGFDQGGDQANIQFDAKFSRNFANGVNLTLDYQRIAQLADRIQFLHQSTRNTALGVGVTFRGKTERYRGYATYSSNKAEQDDNGGLTAEPIVGGTNELGLPSTASVQTQAANTVYRWSTLQYRHYFSLRKKEEPSAALPQRPALRRPTLRRPTLDSLGPDSTTMPQPRIQPEPLLQDTTEQKKEGIFNKQEFLLHHKIAYKSSVYKFFEESPAGASDYYAPFLTDDRGLRYFVNHQLLENQFSLLTYKAEDRPQNEAKGQRGLLELGIIHKLHTINQEPLDTTFNNLFLMGRWRALPTEFLELEAYGHLGILDNIGDFRAEGRLRLALGKIGVLSGEFTSQLSEPSLIHKQHFIAQQSVWNNAFSKVLENKLSASYQIPQARFSVTGTYHLINDMVYFDTLAIAQQASAAVNILQLSVQKDFTVGKFHLDNIVTFQSSSEDFVRLPELFGKHSLYFQGKFFRKILDTRIGVDLRYHSAYFGNAYHAAAGAFHLQDEQEIPLRPLIDFQVSFRITKFRGYIKLENLYTSFFTPSTPRDDDGNISVDLSDTSSSRRWRSCRACSSASRSAKSASSRSYCR
ncbi:MAG: putative porin [Bacteroidota bacterium]